MHDFQEKWRFRQDDDWVLSPEELRLVTPLVEDVSTRLWNRYIDDSARHLMRIVVRESPPSRDVLGRVVYEYSDDWDSDSELVRINDVFASEFDMTDTEVFFFWSAELGVRTRLSVVSRHWTDFCYPSDDSNVLVIPAQRVIVTFVESVFRVRDWSE